MRGSVTAEQAVLRKVRDIPPLSSSAVQLVGLMGGEDRDIERAVRIVECDAGLTTRVLRVVNSPAFGLMEPITSIRRAVSYLGQDMLMGIALDAAIRSVLRRPLKGYEDEKGHLWEHNLKTAIGAREVARLAKEELNGDVAFTGGILHDIGKAILSEFLCGTAEEIISRIDSGETDDYLDGEKEVAGLDHCTAGFELACKWNLAPPLPEVILFHHTPSRADEELRPMIYAVHLGDIISMMGGTGTGSDDMMYHLDSGFSKYFDISEKDLEHVMFRVLIEFERTRKCLFAEEDRNS